MLWSGLEGLRMDVSAKNKTKKQKPFWFLVKTILPKTRSNVFPLPPEMAIRRPGKAMCDFSRPQQKLQRLHIEFNLAHHGSRRCKIHRSLGTSTHGVDFCSIECTFGCLYKCTSPSKFYLMYICAQLQSWSRVVVLPHNTVTQWNCQYSVARQGNISLVVRTLWVCLCFPSIQTA